jgi:hypothetical protein
MPELCATAISDIAQRDTNRLVGMVAKALAANSPFIGLLRGGVFASGISDTVISSIQQQAAPGDSLAVPTFIPATEACGTSGTQELTAAINLSYTLGNKRGVGPKVCVKQGYSAFKTSYLAAEDSLAKLITQYINADIRAQMYLKSASKFTAAAGFNFEDLVVGGTESDVNVLFAAGILPTGPLSFKALHRLTRYVKEALFGEFFETDGKGMPHAKFIAGSDQIELLRAEVNPQLIALTTGQYKLGFEGLTGYSFETSPAYRGLAWTVDQRPLRATGFNPDGTLALVNPVSVITNPANNTAYAVANPAWLAAQYELGFLVFEGSFERQVPEKYVGEGSFKFAPQLHMGELTWHYIVDNTCNAFGDFGWHKYQIERAYRPIRPQHIVPILYRRCRADLGLEPCASGSDFPASGDETAL